MGLRLLIFHLLGWWLPVTLLLQLGSAPEQTVFSPFGDSLSWDLLRLVVLLSAASTALILWKFVVQPELNGFRLNPSQNRKTVEWVMKKFPRFYDTSGEEFAWLRKFEAQAHEAIAEIREFLGSDLARVEFRTAYENNLLSLSPTWTSLNLLSYGTARSDILPRTSRLVNALPNVFNCNVSRVLPRSVLKSHAGESSSYIRCHMGITIPAKAPITALHVGGEIRSWEEGKVTAFCDGHWHGAMNGADSDRLVLIFDVMPERLSWYKRQYCALMRALNTTLYILPGRFNLDEPIWRPAIFAGNISLATVGIPMLAAFYLYFKYSSNAHAVWSRRLREAGFGFYY